MERNVLGSSRNYVKKLWKISHQCHKDT